MISEIAVVMSLFCIKNLVLYVFLTFVLKCFNNRHNITYHQKIVTNIFQRDISLYFIMSVLKFIDILYIIIKPTNESKY